MRDIPEGRGRVKLRENQAHGKAMIKYGEIGRCYYMGGEKSGHCIPFSSAVIIINK